MKLITAIIILAMVTVISGCGRKQETRPPPTVTVAEPIRRDVVVYNEFTGSTSAVSSVDVRARVEGFLDKIAFEDAAFVKKGALLFVIEQDQYKASRDQAKAELQAAQAELERAQIDLKRVEQAAKTNAVSQEEVTNKKAERDKAEAAVAQTTAQLEQAQLNLSYTEIHSPIDGRVSRHLVDIGNLVGAGEKTLLTTVVTMEPIYVYFEVDERKVLEHLSRLKKDFDDLPDVDFFVGLDTEEGYPHEGKLDYVDNTVDPNTGTLTVRGVLPNKDGLLYPGLYARVRVPAGTDKNALLVEEKALGTDLGGKYLYIVKDDNTVELRHVELGPLQDDAMRVIEKGITAGERYIADGLQKARPGLPVTPRTQEQKLPEVGGTPAPESENKGRAETEPETKKHAQPKPG